MIDANLTRVYELPEFREGNAVRQMRGGVGSCSRRLLFLVLLALSLAGFAQEADAQSNSGTISVSVSPTSVTEGDSGHTDHTLTITLSRTKTDPGLESVRLCLGGTATRGSSADYSITILPSLSSTQFGNDGCTPNTSITGLTIGNLMLTATYTARFRVYGDTTLEDPETVTLTLAITQGGLSTTSGTTFGPPATITIANDDKAPPPTVTVHPVPTDGVAKEGQNIWFEFEFDRKTSEPIKLQYTEETPTGSWTVGHSVGAGQPRARFNRHGREFPPLPIVTQLFNTEDDVSDVDGIHEYTITLHDPGPARNYYRVGSPRTATIRVTDNDGLPSGVNVSFASPTSSALEGEVPKIQVNISPPVSKELRLSYTVGGTATPISRKLWQLGRTADYLALPGTVTVPAGAGSVTIPITLLDDGVTDAGETVVLRLGGGSGSGRVHTLTVADSVAMATAQFQPLGWSLVREDDAKYRPLDVRVDVVLDKPAAQDIVIDWTASGTATFGADYQMPGHTAPSGTVTVPRGERRATIHVQILDDDHEDGGETVILTLTGIDSGDAVLGKRTAYPLTILNTDGDTRPEVTVRPGKSPVTEGSPATFTVSRSGATTNELQVLLAVSENEAGDRDFVASGNKGNKTFTIPANQSSVTYPVQTVNDTTDEPNGAVTVALRTDAAYINGSPSSATVTVNDDDDPPSTTPVVSIAADSSSITEGDSASFTLAASPAPQAPITVNVDVSDSGDFAASGETGSRTVTIGTGGTAALTVDTNDDSADEPNGSITAKVGDGGNVYSQDNTDHTATVTVNDNDDAPAATSGSGGSPGPPASDHPEEQEQSPDREALEAIYDAAGGGSWTRNDSWKTSAPIDDWYGVTVEDGRVTRLDLEDNNLEGTLHQDLGRLDKLKALYVNGNSLRGDIPLTQLQGLASLEELALWSNELTGDITDELGKRVDRAALRKIKDVNGSALADWFRENDTPFDYSDWSGVEVNDNGRVTGLDLSGVGLSGELAEAVWEISELSELDLSENPDLRGEVPARVMDGELRVLDISGSGVCAEESEELARWLESIDFRDSENCGETESSGGGSGGCFLASGDVSGERAYQMVIVVLVLAAVVGASRIARAGR